MVDQEQPTPEDGATPEPESGVTDETVETEWQRRRRLAAIFGDVLPDATRDERGPDSGNGKGDEWYRNQVPPHHG